MHRAVSSQSGRNACGVGGGAVTQRQNRVPQCCCGHASATLNGNLISNTRARTTFDRSRAEKRMYKERLSKLCEQYKKLAEENEQLKKERMKVMANRSETSKKRKIAESAVQQLEEPLVAYRHQNAILKARLIELTSEERSLFNEITDLKGKIRVAMRIRALQPTEIANNEISDFKIVESGLDVGKKIVPGSFSHFWPMEMGQASVFNDVQDFIQSALNGYNVSIIFYGETGSGKTFTMIGDEGERQGLLPRALAFMCSGQGTREMCEWQFDFAVNCYEIYNERFADLLNGGVAVTPRFLDGVLVHDGFIKHSITTSQQALDILQSVGKIRTVGATTLNASSSRSHCVFRVEINATNTFTGAVQNSVLTVVDLAGSERVGESLSSGTRFTEAKNINRSLLCLRNVIRGQLNQEKAIRYRDSKLTMALASCLGTGSSKTLLIVTLSPTVRSAAETLRSISFASEACATSVGVATKNQRQSGLQRSNTVQ